MAIANQPASQKILSLFRGCDESDIVDLDQEIVQAESQVDFLKRLRAAVGVGLKMAKSTPGDESGGPPIESKAVQPKIAAAAVTEATKPVMRQKIVHKWFCGVQGGFTLTSEGHVEANRLEGK